MKLPIRIVKVGGSLICRDDLPRRLSRWLEDQSPACNIVLFGGGPLVNAMRQVDLCHAFDSQWMHWSCVDLLEKTYEMGTQWFPAWQVIGSQADFRQWRPSRTSNFATYWLINPTSFYHRVQPAELPADWRTTSDAIAALLGHLVEAKEVVLIKSCEIPPEATSEELVRQEIIDEAFVTTIGDRSFRLESLGDSSHRWS